jgi:hypothetical protein
MGNGSAHMRHQEAPDGSTVSRSYHFRITIWMTFRLIIGTETTVMDGGAVFNNGVMTSFGGSVAATALCNFVIYQRRAGIQLHKIWLAKFQIMAATDNNVSFEESSYLYNFIFRLTTKLP